MLSFGNLFRRGFELSVEHRRTISYATAWAITLVAGAFLAVGVVRMWPMYVASLPATPYEDAEWQQWKERFRNNPEDEAAIIKLRELDKQLRIDYHRLRERMEIGRWMLFIPGLIFLAGALFISEHHRTPNMPQLVEMETFQAKRQQGVQLVVCLMCLVVGGGAGWIAVYWKVEPLPNAGIAGAGPGGKEKPIPPAPEVVDKQWGMWRGPDGSGVSRFPEQLLSFNGKEGKGVIWRSPVPLPGKNSAVVWEDRVFLTGATDKVREVFCYNTVNGKLLWRKKVAPPNPDGRPPEIIEDTGYAAPTSATDGRYVTSLFANGDLVCHSMEGEEVWARNLGRPENQYGISASLVIYEELVLVQIDQKSKEDGKSMLYGITLESGKTKYKVKRPVDESWGSPILIRPKGGSPQLVTVANPLAIGYDPATGKELWRLDCLEGDGGPSPAFAGGLIFVANVDSYLVAIKPGGKGDLEGSEHVAWKGEDGLPDICSPVSNGELVWTIAGGFLTCIDVKTGELVYEHDMEAGYNASPSLVGDKLMLINVNGEVTICGTGREYKELGKASLGEKCDTGPAFAKGRFYLRGHKYLYCIGKE